MSTSDSKILIVDDIPENIQVLRETLENVGHNVSAASSGESALNVLKRVSIDLVLLDIMMPGLSGFDTCSLIKNNPTTKNIPIIFITAKASPEDISKAFKIGAVDYIIKPFNNDEVIARVHTHLALTKSNLALIELNQQKDKFLGMAAHDLRNPLSSVLGYLDLLLSEQETITVDEQREFLTTSINACKIMRTLIGDLLDISAISQGKFSLDMQEFDLRQLLAERLDICKYSAKSKSMSIDIRGCDSVNCFADRNRIGQVIENLLSNAIKYSPIGSNIIIDIVDDPTIIRIDILDQGPGLSNSDIENLFKDFKTLSAKPTGNESSTGLGLSISRRVMDAHKGSITARNLDPCGSCFSIEFTKRRMAA